MKKIPSPRRLLCSWLLVPTFIGVIIEPTQGATITWSGPFEIAGLNDIANASSIVHAINYGDVSDTTVVDVGGVSVSFEARQAPFGDGFSQADVFHVRGEALEFNPVLDSFAFNARGKPSSATEIFTDLIPGGTYLLQVITSDDRGIEGNP